MYYWERAIYGVPLFWRENGIPITINGQRLSRRKLVLWMPTNWAALAVLFLLAPLTLAMRARAEKEETNHD